MSRVSFFQKFSNMRNLIEQNQVELDESRRDLASGRKINKPSDDPTGLTRAIQFQDQEQKLQQFQKNIDRGINVIENTESVSGQLSDLVQRVRELSVRAANDTNDEEERQAIGEEVDQRLEELVGLANTEIANRFLFGGSETIEGEEVFSVERDGDDRITDVTYRGDRFQQNVEVAENEEVARNIPGSEIFQATEKTIASPTKIDPADTDQPLENLPGVQPDRQGTFQINDAKFSYDTSEDSLEDITERINERGLRVGAEITATELSEETNRYTVDSGNLEAEATDPANALAAGDFGGTVDVNVVETNRGIELRQDVPAAPAADGQVLARSERHEEPDESLDGVTNDNGSIQEGVVFEGVDNVTATGGISSTNAFQDVELAFNAKLEDGQSFDIDGATANVQNFGQDSEITGFNTDLEQGTYEVQTAGSERELVNVGTGDVVARTDDNAGAEGEFNDVFYKVESGGGFEFDDSGNRKVAIDFSRETGTSVGVNTNDTPFTAGDQFDVQGGELANEQTFELFTRSNHDPFLRDIDRNQDGTPNEVEGLLNDLNILGDDKGFPPDKRSRDRFPNPVHPDAQSSEMSEGKDLFEVMIDLRDNLFENDTEGISQGIGEVSEGNRTIQINRSVAGARQNRMETTKQRNEDISLNVKELVSDTMDTNLAEVSTDLNRQTTVQRAALQVSGRVLQQTLADFI